MGQELLESLYVIQQFCKFFCCTGNQQAVLIVVRVEAAQNLSSGSRLSIRSNNAVQRKRLSAVGFRLDDRSAVVLPVALR